MTGAELDQLTFAWEQWAREPENQGRIVSRAKLHLLFLLIRFGGLRLNEAINLDLQRDLEKDTGMLRVRGAFARNVLLPLHSMAGIRRIMSLPEAQSPQFLRIDQGFVRRTFYNVAENAGIAGSTAGPRALRYLRGQELLSLHVPLKLVQDCLGLEKPAQIHAFLKSIGCEEKHKAVNSFSGVITSIETGIRSGLIKIKTFSGLFLISMCDMQGLMKLEPRPGFVATALVAPEQVILARKPIAFANCLQGRLGSLYTDPVESFAVVELCDKTRLRADVETSMLSGLEQGSSVLAMFSARAVQLLLA